MKHDHFCNLHCHTTIGSPLDGYGIPEKMVKRAVELNQKAMAITDHGSMTAIVSFKQACEKYGIKPIIGSELYIAPWGKSLDWRRDDGKRTGTGQHLTALAYNQQGYQNLLKLTELANKFGHYYVPRIDYTMLEEYSAGIIVTSGCMASAVCSALNPETGVRGTDYQLVNQVFDFMMQVFGRDRYFIELQGHDIPALKEINLDLSRINTRYKFEYLATNDSHYAVPGDAQGQADAMCVSRNRSRYNPGSFIQGYIDHPGYYMPDYDEMKVKDYGFVVPDSAFTNTLVVADMVEDIKLGYEPDVRKYRFPVMPEYEDEGYDVSLEDLAWRGLLGRYGDSNKSANDRLAHELNIVRTLGFSSYFLCIYDISQFCIEQGIPMTLRGSAGGSIIFYCLHITDFCPLENNLIFERFLNPDRVSAPDADLDIDPSRRGEVIKYLIDKYGEDKAMQVLTINFIRGHQAVRDATRVLEHPFSVGDEVISIVFESGEFNSEGVVCDYHKEIVEAAIGLSGQVRQTGMHAGAIMLSDRPLVMDYPIVRAKSKKAISKMLVGINYEEAESLGGIKIDVLGVEALGILYEAMRLINERHGTDYRFETIPVDDPETYELINSGNLAEIFQLSGPAARPIVDIIKPGNVRDIMVCNSICRPGPAKYAQVFADRKYGIEPVTYKHEDLSNTLKDTYGIMLFQEDIMRTSQVIAGFTGGQADILRKATSKKKGFDKIKDMFIEGAKNNGYDEDFINELWEDILEFSGYGFTAAHACAYARIAIKQAYLKAKYPIEYYAAALTGRGGNEGRLSDILKEMLKAGIKLLPPRLGYSTPQNFSIDDENNAVRFPYGSVKNVGKAGNYLKNVNLLSLDMVNSEHLEWFKKAGTRPLETLAVVGAFDHLFDGDRNEALRAIPYLTRGLPPVKQMSFFKEEDEYTEIDFLSFERDYTGLYLTKHPLDLYDNLDQVPFKDKERYETLNGKQGLYIGIVSSVNLHRDKNGNLMAFLKIEDRDYDLMSVVVFSSVYEQLQHKINIGRVIKILGKIDVDYNKPADKAAKYGRVSIIANHIIGE